MKTRTNRTDALKVFWRDGALYFHEPERKQGQASALQRLRSSTTWMLPLLATLLTPAAFGQYQYERLKAFGIPEQSGASPNSLIEGNDGKLYGTTVSGGRHDTGTVFKMNKDGSGYMVLHHFTGPSGDGVNRDGVNPKAGLVEGRDGVLYGTTEGGSTNVDNPNGMGTVFKLNKDGSGYIVLHSFSGVDGAYPSAPLVEGSDGALYGRTVLGGITDADHSSGFGTVFKLNKDGDGFAVIYSFTGRGEDGSGPNGLVEGSDGALYGTTHCGCTIQIPFGFPFGTVFRLNKDGSGYTLLHRFGVADGVGPNGLMQGRDGALYGTTSSGFGSGIGGVFALNRDGSGYRLLHSGSSAHLVQGSNGALYGSAGGGIFTLNTNGSGYTLLHRFGDTAADRLTPTGLMEGSDGALYGVTSDGGTNRVGIAFKLNTDGGIYSVLRNFSITGGDARLAGRYSFGGPTRLMQGSDGALYGTTAPGDFCSRGVCPAEGTTLYKLNIDGTGYTILHHFTSRSDGYPPNGFIEGTDGSLYGATRYGGTNGQGTVFKLNKDGSGYTILRSFPGAKNDGAPPTTPVEGSDGALYGTTSDGGTASYGTVFKLNKDGSGYTVLRSFSGNPAEGRNPYAAVIEGSDGLLYGTTYYGGITNADIWGGFGTVFKLSKDGNPYRVLHSFTGTIEDGRHPRTALVEGSDGALYGTTQGTVFKLNKDGSGYAVLYRVHSEAPLLALAGTDGALYGTTELGGSHGVGTVFRLNKDGSGYTELHSFNNSNDAGAVLRAALVEGSDGALYGTTHRGGEMGLGTVFVLRPQPVLLLPIVSVGEVTLRITSVRGSTNQVQRANALDGTWSPLTNLTVPLNGVAEFIDPTPLQPSAFYRAVHVP